MPSPESSLLTFLKHLPLAIRKELEEKKREAIARSKRSDILWYMLISSFATMGDSGGWMRLMEHPSRLKRIQYKTLEGIESKKRLKHVETVLREARIRWPGKDRKTGWIVENFKTIQSMGGLKVATKQMRSLKGQGAKIYFLMSFKGMGQKYARNAWMDIYDKDFLHRSVALDTRIKQITKALGYKFKPGEYEKEEALYCDLAKKAKLNTWELDRILYEHYERILRVVG
jgi:hypothetical protein